MIINTGNRTDITQYYYKWLINRFDEEYVLVRNPMYRKQISKYYLKPELVDCVIFCSKNYKPILNQINQITENFNTYFYYTITAYGNEIEPGVPNIDESINTLNELKETVGNKISWRYDPILLTEEYTIERHIQTFKYLCENLKDSVNNCIFSFVDMYKKLDTNMPEIINLKQKDIIEIVKEIGEIGSRNNIKIQTCATKTDYTSYNIEKSGCITLKRLGEVNNINFKTLKHKGIRKNCQCIETRDIGAYNTCPNLCKYCYANNKKRDVMRNYKKHSSKSPLLIGSVEEDDIIKEAKQESFVTTQTRLI